MNSIIKFILTGISKLPFGFLYLLSDVLYVLQRYIIKYRKDIVIGNLTNSFPDKSSKEIHCIANQHFKYFCDYAIETLKSLTITQDQLNKRAQLINTDITDKVLQEKGDMMVLCGHIFNWEWIKVIAPFIPTPNLYAMYHAPKSKIVNDLVKQSREKFGGETLSMNNTRQLLSAVNSKEGAMFLMVADQSPFRTAIHYDIEFLRQTTPVFQGFDKIARRTNMGVVYLNIRRIGRGKYIYDPIEITPDGEQFEENEIIHKYFDLLEKNIEENPANYMWTHKRWKYKKGIHY